MKAILILLLLLFALRHFQLFADTMIKTKNGDENNNKRRKSFQFQLCLAFEKCFPLANFPFDDFSLCHISVNCKRRNKKRKYTHKSISFDKKKQKKRFSKSQAMT